MGAGPNPSQKTPAAPTLPDPLDELIKARQAALRSIAARRGLGSTLLTGAPQAAAPTLLSGTSGSGP